MGGFLAAAAIVLALTPLAARLAPAIGAVDVPTDRPRVHNRPVPRIGGVAIVAAILVPAWILLRPGGPYLGILLGTAAVAALGLYLLAIDQGLALSLVQGELAFDQNVIHELLHDGRHALGVPCH